MSTVRVHTTEGFNYEWTNVIDNGSKGGHLILDFDSGGSAVYNKDHWVFFVTDETDADITED